MGGFSVLIVDDRSQAREGLKALLATAPAVKVVGDLVTQGPIEEALALGQALSFTLTVKGDGGGIEARLRGKYSDRRLAGDD